MCFFTCPDERGDRITRARFDRDCACQPERGIEVCAKGRVVGNLNRCFTRVRIVCVTDQRSVGVTRIPVPAGWNLVRDSFERGIRNEIFAGIKGAEDQPGLAFFERGFKDKGSCMDAFFQHYIINPKARRCTVRIDAQRELIFTSGCGKRTNHALPAFGFFGQAKTMFPVTAAADPGYAAFVGLDVTGEDVATVGADADGLCQGTENIGTLRRGILDAACDLSGTRNGAVRRARGMRGTAFPTPAGNLGRIEFFKTGSVYPVCRIPQKSTKSQTVGNDPARRSCPLNR